LIHVLIPHPTDSSSSFETLSVLEDHAFQIDGIQILDGDVMILDGCIIDGLYLMLLSEQRK
jgi:hypothetical protein